MDEKAKKLNKILSECVAGDLLSDIGRNFYFPSGIVAQAEEAGRFAHKYNVSVGMAFSGGEIFETKAMREHIPHLSPKETASYAPTLGDEGLRQFWLEEILRKNPGAEAKYISMPVIVPGLTNAIFQIASLFIDKGDKAILASPYWSNYKLAFSTHRQGVLAAYPFYNSRNGFNVEACLDLISKSKKNEKIIVLFNFPNNPAGYSLTKEEASRLVEGMTELADQGRKILAVCDDAYFGLNYEQEVFPESLFSPLGKAHPNILAAKADGFTKEHFAWGIRLGFLTFAGKGMGPEQMRALADKLKGLLRVCVSSSNKTGQSIFKKIIEREDYRDQIDYFRRELKARYLRVKEIVKRYADNKYLVPRPFNSGYFMSFTTKGSAEQLRQKLLLEKGIGTVSFGDDCLRIAYSCADMEDLDGLFSEVYKSAESLFKKTT